MEKKDKKEKKNFFKQNKKERGIKKKSFWEKRKKEKTK